ncbi:MAG: hypothetical protein GY906_06140 [bacterium]|nr:hypothetical protein [bacterium]
MKGHLHWRRANIQWAVFAYVVLSFGSVFFSRDPLASAAELGELAAFLLVPMTASLLNGQRWDRLLMVLTGVSVVSSSYGLWQYLHGASDLSNRLHGLNNHYMTFSGWTLIVVLLLLGDIAFNRDPQRLMWTIPAFGISSIALLLSFTRSAWVGLGAGLCLVAIVWRPKALYAYSILLLLLWLLLPGPILNRAVSIFDLRDDSNYDRLCMVKSGIQMASDFPVFGVGLGMVQVHYANYRVDDAPRKKVPHLHNNVVQIAAERGLFGLAAYASILFVFVFRTWRGVRTSKRPEFPALVGCLLAVAGITVAGLFEYNWGDAEVGILTLVCLGAPFALMQEAS